MVHISELAWNRTNKVEDALKLGDVVKVKITKVDDKGRVDASVRALLENQKAMKNLSISHANVVMGRTVMVTVDIIKKNIWS